MCELLGMSANVPTDICFSFRGLMQRGGATVVLVAFTGSLGVSFMLLDVDRLRSDEDCEGALKKASRNGG